MWIPTVSRSYSWLRGPAEWFTRGHHGGEKGVDTRIYYTYRSRWSPEVVYYYEKEGINRHVSTPVPQKEKISNNYYLTVPLTAQTNFLLSETSTRPDLNLGLVVTKNTSELVYWVIESQNETSKHFTSIVVVEIPRIPLQTCIIYVPSTKPRSNDYPPTPTTTPDVCWFDFGGSMV